MSCIHRSHRGLVLPLVFAIAFAVIGCGEGQAPEGAKADVQPEIKKANQSMEDFVKQQKK